MAWVIICTGVDPYSTAIVVDVGEVSVVLVVWITVPGEVVFSCLSVTEDGVDNVVDFLPLLLLLVVVFILGTDVVVVENPFPVITLSSQTQNLQ